MSIVSILLFHWIGDFLMQTTEMATQKSKSNYWLTKHVKAYILGILPVTALIIFSGGSIIAYIMWWIINGILHWITDYFTSRWTSKLYAAEKFYGFPAFFSVIGLDQLIHSTCLIITFYLCV